MKDPSDQGYGSSSTLCDYVLRHQLQEAAPGSIVDFGAGGGKIGRLVRDTLGGTCRLEAVEGYAPAAQHLAQRGVYDRVHHALIQEWPQGHLLERYDMAIFGDAMEHLTPRQVRRVVRQCLGMFKEVVIVVPLCDLTQGPIYDNPLEIHRTYITAGFFDRYLPMETHIIHGDRWTIMNVRLSADPPGRRRPGVFSRAYHAGVLALQFFGSAQPVTYFFRRASRKARRWFRG